MSLIYGYVKLFKSLNVAYGNDLRVYIHLLLNAGYKVNKLDDITLQPGQLLTSYQAISESLNITRKQVIVAVEHLINDKVIEWQGIPKKYSICTIMHYNLQESDNAYNYAKLYRSIQGANWYTDGAAANLYYYILLCTDGDKLRVKRGDVVNALGITPRAYYTALDRLKNADAVKYSKEGTYYIIDSCASYKTDGKSEDKDKTTPPTVKHSNTAPATSHKPSSSPTNSEGDGYLNQIFAGF